VWTLDDPPLQPTWSSPTLGTTALNARSLGRLELRVMAHRLLVLVLASFFAGLGGCDDDEPRIETGDAGGDTLDAVGAIDLGGAQQDTSTVAVAQDTRTAEVAGHIADSARMSDMTLPSCCEIDQQQRCGCLQIGGTRLPNGACPAVCDAVPIVVRRYTDENGCPAVQLSLDSCIKPPDASAGN
jgi:hypothetical protein